MCRALRIKKGWRQVDVAARARVARTTVSDLETGHVSRLRVEAILRVIEALGGRIDFVVRWQGGELDRLLNSRHSQLHESLAQMFESLADWQIAPEVSFNIRGERGVVDILAWHAATRTLLVIELKTDIVDMNEMLGTLDRKTRLAKTIARERGWFPERVARLARHRRELDEQATRRAPRVRPAARVSGRRSSGAWMARGAGSLLPRIVVLV